MTSESTDYSTLKEMKDYFVTKSDALSDCLKYRLIDGDLAKRFIIIKSALSELNEIFKETRKEIALSKENVKEMQNLLEKVENTIKRLNHMEHNFPAVLKRTVPNPEKKIEPAQKNVLKENAPSGELKNAKTIAQMSYLTLKEYENIPKYMKGRLKYEQINKFVDDFNDVVMKKYQLLKMPRKELKPPQLDAVKKLKEQENSDTKGIYFCTADDLKTHKNIKIDKNISNMLTILRHCVKVKEIRSPGIIRYAIVA